MTFTVSAVCLPQRWPGSSGVGGALVQSHPCRAPVCVGEGGGWVHYTPFVVQQMGEKD